jgi:hypothetical protein
MASVFDNEKGGPVDIKEQKNLRFSKPPSYASEITFVMVNMFLAKFYSERFFEAMTFFNIAVPMMLYLIVCLFKNLIEFMKLLQIEDMSSSDEDSLVTPGQQKLLVRIFRDLCAYFGVYYLSA